MNMKKSLLFFVLTFLAIGFVSGQTTRYVTFSGAGVYNGTSWANAYSSTQLQTAINESGVTEVWVAAGTYKPTSGTDRTIAFSMKGGVSIYGGFTGTETSLNERNWSANLTILSGDIGSTGDTTGNSYRVIFNDWLSLQSGTAILDGFTVQDANNVNHDYGGGLYNFQSSPLVANCTFSGNFGHYGGGICNRASSPTYTNCKISGNSVTFVGGGIYNENANPTFINCSIAGNSANIDFTGKGGGMYSENSRPVLINNTISGNSAYSGGGLYNDGARLTLKNSIIWDNTAKTTANQIYTSVGDTLRYSCYANGGNDIYINTGGTFTVSNCITTDPIFINPSYDVRIAEASPCADAGNDTYNNQTTDIRGTGYGRKLLKTNSSTTGPIDMGAYEYKKGTDPEFPELLRIYVKANATGSNNGTSWTNAYTSLQSALTAAGKHYEIWVAAGTYKPTSGTDRVSAFNMKNDLAIYGGFAGTETSLTQRNWTTNLTILSGNIGSAVVNTDNSYMIIYNNWIKNTAILDGFTVQDARQDIGYYGGGMYNLSSSPTISNCSFSANFGNYGGGICNRFSSPTLINCKIIGNNTSFVGGGVYNGVFSSPTLINSTISRNAVSNFGGGMYNESSSSPTLNNSIIWGNTAGTLGYQICMDGGTTTLNHSCYANGVSDIIGGTVAASSSITTDPLFVDANNNDYRILGSSPCADAGNDTYNNETTDIRGTGYGRKLLKTNSSTAGPIDMGAYEYNRGTDPYSILLWAGSVSNNWNVPGNWNPGTAVPSALDLVIIPDVITDPIISDFSPANCMDLMIQSGSVLTIASNNALTVSNTLTNSAGTDGLVVNSGGSLIHNTANVSATVKREVTAWGNAMQGWHLLSSPVAVQPISGDWTPSGGSGDYDFYLWDEPSTLWLNFKNSTTPPLFSVLNPGTNFVVGRGYMVAYEQTGTRAFTGVLNVANVVKSGLTNNSTAPYSWNLLGNPYPCALTWLTPTVPWNTTNIGGVCQIWNDGMGSYSSLVAGDPIPALNGFMVETFGPGGGSLTIPAAARTHSATSWYKNTTTSNLIKLTVWDEDKKTGKESKIFRNPASTAGFDPDYDGHYLSDYAPSFYSLASDDKLSVNTLPALGSDLKIPFVFIKNSASNFTIELDTEDVISDLSIYLTDNKTGVEVNLSENPVYQFSSADGDDINRFLISFPTTGIAPEKDNNNIQVYTSQNILYINQSDRQSGKVNLCSVAGQLICTYTLEATLSQSITLPQMTPGIYLVNILSNVGSYTRKVVIR